MSKLDLCKRARPLEGQTALVTGASRGIGRGIALQLAEAGATIYITGRHPQESLQSKISDIPSLEQTAQGFIRCVCVYFYVIFLEISRRGGESVMVYCNHANSSDVKKLFEKIEKDHDSTLDILVNNAFAGAPVSN